MRKNENHCVQCDLPCIGRACPYVNVEVVICDVCDELDATYHIDGEDYCEECAKRYMQSVFDELAITERAEVLGLDISRID